jgi:hypothetical protein
MKVASHGMGCIRGILSHPNNSSNDSMEEKMFGGEKK